MKPMSRNATSAIASAGSGLSAPTPNRLARYVMGREKRGKREAITAGALADKQLHALTERDLLNWRNRLPDTLKAASKQRLINDLKAALNAAYAENRSRLDRPAGHHQARP